MMQLEGFQANRACDLARVSRAGFYRNYAEHAPLQADVELRDLIQRIVLENRFYGYRRVTAELDHRGVVGESQAGAAADARRQSAGGTQATLRPHH